MKETSGLKMKICTFYAKIKSKNNSSTDINPELQDNKLLQCKKIIQHILKLKDRLMMLNLWVKANILSSGICLKIPQG
jgi:hypothetical protein